MAGIAEGAMDHAHDSLVEIGVVVDHDRVLAPHLGDDALEVILARLDHGGLAIDQKAHVARAGERDDVDVGMIDEGLTDLLAQARQVIEHARWQPGLGETSGQAARR